jgi:hypothetical protein
MLSLSRTSQLTDSKVAAAFFLLNAAILSKKSSLITGCQYEKSARQQDSKVMAN